MVLVDFHCHLDWKSFESDRNLIIEQMKKDNIIAFTNTVNQKNFEETFEMMKSFDNVNVCPGLYPQDAEEILDEDFENYLNILRNKKDDFLVIGEVGLDRYHTKKNDDMSESEKLEITKKWEKQEKRFRSLIELGIELDKPLCIHTRKAESRVLEILEEYVTQRNFNKFNLHCFSGKKKLINKIKELNIMCSIPLTILNTQSFQILVELLPIKQLLVETDSPFLNPDKTRNSPLNIPKIYEKIAEIKGLDKKEIENIIYSNFQRLVYL